MCSSSTSRTPQPRFKRRASARETLPSQVNHLKCFKCPRMGLKQLQILVRYFYHSYRCYVGDDTCWRLKLHEKVLLDWKCSLVLLKFDTESHHDGKRSLPSLQTIQTRLIIRNCSLMLQANKKKTNRGVRASAALRKPSAST